VAELSAGGAAAMVVVVTTIMAPVRSGWPLTVTLPEMTPSAPVTVKVLEKALPPAVTVTPNVLGETTSMLSTSGSTV